MLREAEELFREHQKDGRVTIEYDTKVYYGRLRQDSLERLSK